MDDAIHISQLDLKHPHGHIQRYVYMVIQNPVKLVTYHYIPYRPHLLILVSLWLTPSACGFGNEKPQKQDKALFILNAIQ